MTYETLEEFRNREDILEIPRAFEDLEDMSLETQHALIKNANLQYCIANHLI